LSPTDPDAGWGAPKIREKLRQQFTGLFTFLGQD